MTGERRTQQNRRNDDMITRTEFVDFQEETRKYRCDQNKKLDGIHTALFAPDEQNENRQQGLMVTARNIDNHITAVCNIARWIYRSTLAVVAVGAPSLAIAKAMGWL